MNLLPIILSFLLVLLIPASCQVCTTTCDHALSPPAAAARDVIRRGKSGPRGEKGDRGSTGAKGADHGVAVSRNSAVLAEHGAELKVFGGKIESQEGVIARQEETIGNLTGVVREQAAEISHLSDVTQDVLGLFLWI